MKQTVLRRWWLLGVRGAVSIVFGVLAILWPGMTLLSLAALFAAFTMVGGALWMFAALNNRPEDECWWIVLLLGLVGVAAGTAVVLHPALSMLVLILLVGTHAVVSGVLELSMSFHLRKQIRGEWRLEVAATASVLFGLIVLLFPTGTQAIALAMLTGFHAIATGMLMVALAFKVRSWSRLNQGRSSPAAGPVAPGA